MFDYNFTQSHHLTTSSLFLLFSTEYVGPMAAVRSRSPQVGAQGDCVDQGHHCLTLDSCLPKPGRQRTARRVSGNMAETVGLGCSLRSADFIAHLRPCSFLKEGRIFCSTRTLFLSTFHPRVSPKTNCFSAGATHYNTLQLLGDQVIVLFVLTGDFKVLGAQWVFGLQFHFQKWYEPQICGVAI